MQLEPLGSLAAKLASELPELAQLIRRWRGNFDRFWPTLQQSEALHQAMESVRVLPAKVVSGSDRRILRAFRSGTPMPHALSWQWRSEELAPLAWVDFLKCVEYGVLILECPLCGRYFPKDGTRAVYCPDCRTKSGKALRVRAARAAMSEEERAEARRWNALRMRVLREAAAGHHTLARQVIKQALAGDTAIKARIAALKPGSRLYNLLSDVAWRLHMDGQITLPDFRSLFLGEAVW